MPISPTFDPRNLKSALDALPDNAVVQAAHRCMTRARDSIEKFEIAQAAIERDLLLDETARAVQINELRGKLDQQIRSALDEGYERVTSAIENMDEQARVALVPTRRSADPGEIRRHVSALSDGERRSFLDDRAAAGDVESLNAVLAAPAYLSGFDEATLGILRERVDRTLDPMLAKRREALRRVARQLEAAGSAASHHYLNKRDHRGERAVERADERRRAIAETETN